MQVPYNDTRKAKYSPMAAAEHSLWGQSEALSPLYPRVKCCPCNDQSKVPYYGTSKAKCSLMGRKRDSGALLGMIKVKCSPKA